MNNYYVVEKLLKFSISDINIKVKDGLNEIGFFGRKIVKDVVNDFKWMEIFEFFGYIVRLIDLYMF